MKRRKKEKEIIRQSLRASGESFADNIGSKRSKIISVCRSLYAKQSECSSRISTSLSDFAEKPFSLPVFIVIAFLLTALAAYINGTNIIKLRQELSWQTYQFYLCDYSAGVSSRMLIGQIISLFTDKVSLAMMEYITGISLLISHIAQSVISAIFFRKGVKQKNFTLAVFSLILVCNPLVITGGYRLPGTIDHYILILFFAALLLLNTRGKALYIPILCVVGILLHCAFICTYFPAILSLLFFEMINEEKMSRKICIGTGIGVSTVATVGSFIYFSFVKLNHFTLTADEFYEYMASRFIIPQEKIYEIHNNYSQSYIVFRDYFDIYLFGMFRDNDKSTPSALVNLLKWIADYFTDDTLLVNSTVILAAITIIYFAVIFLYFHRQKGIKKLPVLPFFFVPFVYIFDNIFSPDLWRFAGSTIISEVLIVCWLLSRKNSDILNMRDKNSRTKSLISALCFVVFAFSTVFCLIKGYL